MPLNEADTRAKLITPALHNAGWPEDWIRREQRPGPIIKIGSDHTHGPGKTDYLLHIRMQNTLIPVALLEAKAEHADPASGLEQAKRDARLHHVPFAFASNGHQFHEADLVTNKTRGPLPLDKFPTWQDLADLWADLHQLEPSAHAARPLWVRPRDGARYYQRAALRAVLQQVAAGRKRMLLPMATGTGKTRVAVEILRALDSAGQLRRALFLCDRDELRTQALGALSAHFKSDAAKANTRDPAKNARVIVATYQTLGIDEQNGDASFLKQHYPENYFSHIVIDECHRSAWGKWSEVLTRNPDAVHIGLTATPRDIDTGDATNVDFGDAAEITANNYDYFGDPVYEYPIAQAMQDGYLAFMEVVRSDVWTADTLDRLEGVERERLAGSRVSEAVSGQQRSLESLRERYAAGNLEQELRIPQRVEAMSRSLFNYLLRTGGPHQKTLIFCASINHANEVVQAVNNHYAAWCKANGEPPTEPYAFTCTAEGGRELIADLRGSSRRAFIAATVDLITTGVDVPRLQNIAFFRYIKSPILFHQMLGRGTRIDEPSGKRHFTVYDYTNATRLLDASLKQRAAKPPEPPDGPTEPVEHFRVEGVQVRIERGEHLIAAPAPDGTLEFVTLAEYGQRIAAELLADTPELAEFRNRWLQPNQREALIARLEADGLNLSVYRSVADRLDTDHYDILAALGWQETIRTREERAERIESRESDTMLRVLARQFSVGGTEALETTKLFEVPAVRDAGGIDAFGDISIIELKRDLLATDTEWAA